MNIYQNMCIQIKLGEIQLKLVLFCWEISLSDWEINLLLTVSIKWEVCSSFLKHRETSCKSAACEFMSDWCKHCYSDMFWIWLTRYVYFSQPHPRQNMGRLWLNKHKSLYICIAIYFTGKNKILQKKKSYLKVNFLYLILILAFV